MKFNFIQHLDGNLRVFRDDLYPFLGGGNKGRKMDAIAKAIFSYGANALVTTGGIQSNHCRAVAVFAAAFKMKCTLVLHGDKKSFFEQSGNAKVMRSAGAEIVFVDAPHQIGKTMDEAMDRYKGEGSVPFYIYGGGHMLEGGKAYIDAIEESKEYCEETNWEPEYIFHASGTGSTQSGIMSSLDKFGLHKTKVIGISVGRNAETATRIVKDFYTQLCENYHVNSSKMEPIVLDDYLCGGYEMFNDELKNLSDQSLQKYGFLLDTCYSGKAFYGMKKYLEKNKIEGNVLFWHTGGVFNFLAK